MKHYLSLILFTPLAGALVLLLVNKENVNAISPSSTPRDTCSPSSAGWSG